MMDKIVPGFFSRSFMFLSISLYKLSHNDLRLPNTLNKFHRYSSSTAGMNKRLFWFKNLWDFFTANFSIGNDFPAILCLYLGTSLEFLHTYTHKPPPSSPSRGRQQETKKKCLLKSEESRKQNASRCIVVIVWTCTLTP